MLRCSGFHFKNNDIGPSVAELFWITPRACCAMHATPVDASCPPGVHMLMLCTNAGTFSVELRNTVEVGSYYGVLFTLLIIRAAWKPQGVSALIKARIRDTNLLTKGQPPLGLPKETSSGIFHGEESPSSMKRQTKTTHILTLHVPPDLPLQRRRPSLRARDPPSASVKSVTRTPRRAD